MRQVSLCILGWPVALYLDKAGLELAEICLILSPERWG